MKNSPENYESSPLSAEALRSKREEELAQKSHLNLGDHSLRAFYFPEKDTWKIDFYKGGVFQTRLSQESDLAGELPIGIREFVTRKFPDVEPKLESEIIPFLRGLKK